MFKFPSGKMNFIKVPELTVQLYVSEALSKFISCMSDDYITKVILSSLPQYKNP
jgi:hypothetical protein